MKTSILTLTAIAAMVAGSVTIATDASAKKFRKGSRDWAYSNYHRLTKRQRDTLPISVTRPPNARHYIHQDFPLWAARAFQSRR